MLITFKTESTAFLSTLWARLTLGYFNINCWGYNSPIGDSPGDCGHTLESQVLYRGKTRASLFNVCLGQYGHRYTHKLTVIVFFNLSPYTLSLQEV